MRWFLWLRCYAEAWSWRWLPLNRALGFSAGNIEFEDFGSWIMKRSYNLRTKN
ncbi:beta-phosphoglucomutase [Vibrio cholerae MS6]|nr:hypothetical protein ASZ83_02884 [Vibrio cholerae]BAP04689.1 beta-phosphoglucomutase [Vibrio cholerae MS6]